jgi:hypothetical protein
MPLDPAHGFLFHPLIALVNMVTVAVSLFSGTLKLCIAVLFFVSSLVNSAPLVALRDGDQVLCGGARIWTCDARAEFTMVEHTGPRDHERLGLPHSYRPNVQAEPFPEPGTKQEGRRDQRGAYLYLDRLLLDRRVSIFNFFATYASGMKLAEVLGSHQITGMTWNTEVRAWLMRDYPEEEEGISWWISHGAPMEFESLPPRGDVLLLTDYALERDPDPIALLGRLPRTYPHIVMTYWPRIESQPTPPYLLRQWTRPELVRLLESRGFIIEYSSDSWVHMHHKDLPKEAYYMLGTKLVPASE